MAGNLLRWDAGSGQRIEPIRSHGLAVTAVAAMNQGIVKGGYVSASRDQTVRWSAQEPGKDSIDVITTVRGFAEPVTAFVQGPGFMALGGEGGSVAIADISIDEPRFVFRAHDGPVNAMVLGAGPGGAP